MMTRLLSDCQSIRNDRRPSINIETLPSAFETWHRDVLEGELAADRVNDTNDARRDDGRIQHHHATSKAVLDDDRGQSHVREEDEARVGAVAYQQHVVRAEVVDHLVARHDVLDHEHTLRNAGEGGIIREEGRQQLHRKEQ